MKKILIPLFFALSNLVFGQNYPVEVSFGLNTPYSTDWRDYQNPVSPLLEVELYLKDLEEPQIQVYLQFEISGPGLIIRSKKNLQNLSFNLSGGETLFLSHSMLSPYFSPDHIDFLGKSYREIMAAGKLPEGAYTFSIEVFEKRRNISISNRAFDTGWLVVNDPPVVNYPAHGDKIMADLPQQIPFQWTPGHLGSPNSSFSTTYKIEVVEIRTEGINPNEVFSMMPLIYSEETFENLIVLEDPLLIPGQKYAWRVQAVPGNSQYSLFKNEGFSEVVAFTYGDPCLNPEFIEIGKVGSNLAGISWGESASGTGFLVNYKPETSQEWYSKESLFNSITLSELHPETTYLVNIVSKCGPFHSQSSPELSFTTTVNESVVNCEAPEPFQYSGEETFPVFAGDTIKTNGFSVITDDNSSQPGKGRLIIPFFKRAKLLVSLHNVGVNTAGFLSEGYISVDPVSSTVEELRKIDESIDIIAEDTDQILSEIEDEVSEENDTTISNTDEPVVAVVDDEAVSDSLSGNQVGMETPTTSPGNTSEGVGEPSGEVTSPTGNVLTSASATEDVSTSPSLDKTMRFGLVDITFAETPTNPDSVNGNLCSYSGLKAQATLHIDHYRFEKSLEASGSLINFTRNCEEGSIVELSVKWEGNYLLGKAGIFEFYATAINVQVNSEGEISGRIVLNTQIHANSRLLTLENPVEGKVIYNYNGDQGFGGWFDFSGLKGMTAGIIKEGEHLIEGYGLTFSEEGTARLSLQNPTGWTLVKNNTTYAVLLKSLEAQISIWDGLLIKNLEAEVEVSGIPGIPEAISGLVVYEEDSWQADITGSFNAFGMSVEKPAMHMIFDKNLNPLEISGSFTVNHPLMEGHLEVTSFLIKDGSLQQFNALGSISYQGQSMEIHESNYNPESENLELNATLTVQQGDNLITASVNPFNIDKNGNITMGEYSLNADLNQKFGPVTLVFSSHPESSGNEGRYKTFNEIEATLILDVNTGNQIVQKTLAGALVSFKKRRNGTWKDFTAKITASDIPLGGIYGFDASLHSLEISLSDSENPVIQGNLEAGFKLSEDLKLLPGNISNIDIVLKEGLTGDLVYSLNATDSSSSEWEISSIGNFSASLVKGGSEIAWIDVEDFNDDGLLTGNLRANPEKPFKMGESEIALVESSLRLSLYPFREEKDFKFLEGNAKLSVSGIKNITGKLVLNTSFDEENVFATASDESDFSAYGLAFSNLHIDAEMTRNFDLVSIQGSMTAAHPDFNTEIHIQKFLISKGELSELISKNNKINYRGFDFELENLEYGDGSLNASAKLQLDLGGEVSKMDISSFEIDEYGQISVGSINGRLDKSPLLIEFESTFGEKRFTGHFSGNFKNYFSLDGSLDIGVEDSYQFGYLSLSTKTRLPLFAGIMITRLSGSVGYNYMLEYDEESGDFTGRPYLNNHLIGLGLGLSDQAGILEIYGKSTIQFGSGSTKLNLTGGLNIPAADPSFAGEVEVEYNFDEKVLKGKSMANISIPTSNGALFKAENIHSEFIFEKEHWSIQTPDFQGEVFGKVAFLGRSEMVKSGESFRGSLSGELAYSFNYEVEADLWAGDFRGSANLELYAFTDLRITNDAVEGLIESEVNGNIDLELTTPLGSVDVSTSFRGSLLVEHREKKTMLRGDMDFSFEAAGSNIEYTHQLDTEI